MYGNTAIKKYSYIEYNVVINYFNSPLFVSPWFSR